MGSFRTGDFRWSVLSKLLKAWMGRGLTKVLVELSPEAKAWNKYIRRGGCPPFINSPQGNMVALV
jgi:hypothetical protein